MKYRAVILKKLSSTAVSGIWVVFTVLSGFFRVYILNLTKQNAEGRSTQVCGVLEWFPSCLELNVVPNRWKTFLFTWDNCKAAKWLHSNFPKLGNICCLVTAKHEQLLPRRDIVVWKERDSYNWLPCWAWKFHLNLVFSITLLQHSHELHHCWSRGPGAADPPSWCNKLLQQKLWWVSTLRNKQSSKQVAQNRKQSSVFLPKNINVLHKTQQLFFFF